MNWVVERIMDQRIAMNTISSVDMIKVFPIACVKID